MVRRAANLVMRLSCNFSSWAEPSYKGAELSWDIWIFELAETELELFFMFRKFLFLFSIFELKWKFWAEGKRPQAKSSQARSSRAENLELWLQSARLGLIPTSHGLARPFDSMTSVGFWITEFIAALSKFKFQVGYYSNLTIDQVFILKLRRELTKIK